MNFAPGTLSLPEDIGQVGVDLTIELEQFSFSVVNRSRRVKDSHQRRGVGYWPVDLHSGHKPTAQSQQLRLTP